MNRRRAAARGFTLIELMIVVSIIGLLAAIAIPEYKRFTCKAAQTEAKRNLKRFTEEMVVYNAEAPNVAENFTMSKSPCFAIPPLANFLGARLDGTTSRYMYTFSRFADAPLKTFAIAAIGCGQLAGDNWNVVGAVKAGGGILAPSPVLTHTFDACGNY